MNSNILVPHEFFKKSKKEYNNWIFAFLREIIQNSVDAKSKNISFEVFEQNNEIKFICEDDGCGMDSDTLINVLLCLGGSKKEKDAIGGFGYAKTLLFFAHKSYKIETQNKTVEGSGGSYSIHDSNKFIDGTKITIIMDISDDIFRTISPYTFKFEFNRIMENSFLPKVNFFWNLDNVKNNKQKSDYTFDTTIGQLKFSDSEENTYGSTLWVRVNGLAMFEHSVYKQGSCFNGVLDLDKSPTEVLTSNRDALKGDSKIEFNKIIESLQNERSALKSETTLDFILNPIHHNLYQHEQKTSSNVEQVHKLFSDKDKIDKPEHKQQSVKAEFSPFQKIHNKNSKELDKLKNLEQSINSDNLPNNFIIQQGESVNYSHAEIKRLLSQTFSVKISHAWKRIVYSILNAIEQVDFVNSYGEKELYYGQEGTFHYGSRKIHIGFCFDDCLGLNVSNSESIRILLNIQKIKEMKSKKNFKINKLLDIAFHEISHIFVEGHGENFSSLEMQIKWIFYDFYKTKDINKIGVLSIF